MRILLDECVHSGVRRAFSGHAVQTVAEIGWRTSKDTPLLEHAATRFDVFVSIDRKLADYPSLPALDLAIVLVRVPDNRMQSYEPILAEIRAAAEGASAGEVRVVIHPAMRGRGR